MKFNVDLPLAVVINASCSETSLIGLCHHMAAPEMPETIGN